MSWADKIQAKQPKKLPEVYTQMPLLKSTIKNAKEYCESNRQDWVTFVVGNEGSGKSTIASHICELFDSSFTVDDSIIYSFQGNNHSFLNFYQKYKDVPYKVAWYDEAVTVLFSLHHSTKESADAQAVFKLKRDSRHYDILVSPSFWDVVPDIRERRIKSLIYCFTEVSHPTNHITKYKHLYAYYSKEKIIKLSIEKKAKFAFGSPRALFKLIKPDFIEEFPQMNPSIETEYMICKRHNRDALLDRISGKTPSKTVEAIISSEPLLSEKEILETEQKQPKKRAARKKKTPQEAP